MAASATSAARFRALHARRIAWLERRFVSAGETRALRDQVLAHVDVAIARYGHEVLAAMGGGVSIWRVRPALRWLEAQGLIVKVPGGYVRAKRRHVATRSAA